MISKTIAGMCVLGFAANCAAQLQEYSFDEPYRAPSEASITCFDGVHIAPDYEIMYFDIRLPPSSQPTGSFSGTFVIDGDCDAGGSFARSIILSSFCDGGYPDAGTNSLRFAFAADPIPTGTPLYGLSGQPESEIKIYVGFQPGDSVGPGNSFGNGMLLGQSPLYLDDNPLFNNPHDIDVVGDGIIFGIEITETDAIRDLARTRKLMESLRADGVRFALDDFGSGFCSFGYLRPLPVDYVKIDVSFVRDLANDPGDRAIVRAIVEVAKSLGKQTVAECVENEAARAMVAALEVDYAQGYATHRPEMIETLLDTRRLAGQML